MHFRLVYFFLLAALLFIPFQFSSAQTYQAGIHYTELAQPVSVRNPDKIEVVEVFRYDCGGCYQFDPTAKKWRDRLAGDVVFEYLPGPYTELHQHYARTFYTARALGILAQAHTAIFDQIHVHRKYLREADEVAEFFTKFGVDKGKTIKTYNSFGITSLVKQAEARINGYNAFTTPELVVHGRYRIEINDKVKNHQDLVSVADFLIAKVRAEGI